MWVRFHKCYSALIRSSLGKLKSRSLTFCCSTFCTGSTGRRTTGPPQISLLPSEEDTIFLQLGSKTVYVTEPQVSCWNDLDNNTSGPISVLSIIWIVLLYKKYLMNIMLSSDFLTFPVLVPTVSRRVVISATGLWSWGLLRGEVHRLKMFPS